MITKPRILIVIVLLALFLSACASSSPDAIPPVVLNPSASTTTQTGSGGGVTASAEVVPASKVNLSFALVGTVKTVEVQVGDTVKAGDVLVTLNPVILEARVAEAEAGVASAETQVRYLRRVGPGDEQLNAAMAEADRARAVVEQAKATLEQASLTAPIDGTIVAVETAPGETATPGKVLVIIGDLSRMQIETNDLSERDIPEVQIGQKATVFIEALGSEFTGTVSDIARTSEIVGGDVVFRVTIELDEQPEGLRWGMSADVEIQAGQ
jgi:multidrug efflux pump subunit AcrA (membrane-fusion protein)